MKRRHCFGSNPLRSYKIHAFILTTLVDSRIDEIVVNKHWRVNFDFGHAGNLSLQLY